MSKTLAAAQEKALQAIDNYSNLSRRLREGDLQVTQKALTEARAAAEFAEAQLEGVRANARRAAEVELKKSVEATHDEIRATFSETSGAIVAKADEVRAALAELAEAVAEHNEANNVAAGKLSQLNPKPGERAPEFISKVSFGPRDSRLEYLLFNPLSISLGALRDAFASRLQGLTQLDSAFITGLSEKARTVDAAQVRQLHSDLTGAE